LVYFALGPVRTAHGRLFCCGFLFMLLQPLTILPSTDHPLTVWQSCDPAHFLMRAAAGSHCVQCTHCAHFLGRPPHFTLFNIRTSADPQVRILPLA